MVATGIIFDIKQMAVFDGPGIRTTVFFKGCNLRCQWCHNPEGLEKQPQLMISHPACTHCGRCVEACPSPDRANCMDRCPNPSHCDGCFACTSVCPLNLRKVAGKEYTATKLVQQLLKNKDILQMNHGGITFSGGEPLLQAPFLLEVLEQLDEMHTAIETCGHCNPDYYKAVIDRLDFVMMDIKIVDSVLHKKYTGVDNKLILQNLKTLISSKKPFVIRVPLIPGVNDNQENLRQTTELLKDATTLQKIELLPYHQTAGAKYQMLGKEYAPEFDTNRTVNNLQSYVESLGFPCSIL